MTSEEFVKGQYKNAIVVNNKLKEGYTCLSSKSGEKIGKGKNPTNAWVNARKKLETIFNDI